MRRGSTGNCALTLGWWLCAIPFLLLRRLERRADLHSATLIDHAYAPVSAPHVAPLVHVGRRRAPRDEQADVAQVYLLPEDSPLGRYNVHVLVSSNPRIYVGAALPQLLGKQAMRAVIAHELGHCFDTGQAAADIALIAWRALALPALLAGATRLVYGASPAAIGPSWFALAVACWLVARWGTLALLRRREYAADAYAARIRRL